MNAVTACSYHSGLQKNGRMKAADRTLYKFISIIHGADEIEVQTEEKKVVSWLNNKIAEAEIELHDEFLYRNLIYPYLCLSYKSSQKKIYNRKKIALQYAKIVDQYVPDDNGNINQRFNYFQLVWTIKTVFKEHITKNESLYTGGIMIAFTDCCFFAKLENKQIYIISGEGTLINQGGFGSVTKVYEIATRKFFALKNAHGDIKSVDLIRNEIFNLNAIHDKASNYGLSVKGLQDRPIATFDFHFDECDLDGFIGQKYGINLLEWSLELHTNEERIGICKSLMTAYKNKMHLGYWHGDIKLDNILMNEEGVVMIDWAGSVLLQEAVEKFIVPGSLTNSYMNEQEVKCLLSLRKSKRHTFEKSIKFIQTAEAMDLFSLAMVLFMTLTSKIPFYCEINSPPDTKAGICSDSLDDLHQRHYSENVVNTIIKMLADDPIDRYSVQEAIDVWENKI